MKNKGCELAVTGLISSQGRGLLTARSLLYMTSPKTCASAAERRELEFSIQWLCSKEYLLADYPFDSNCFSHKGLNSLLDNDTVVPQERDRFNHLSQRAWDV